MSDRLDRLVGDAVHDLASGADVISDRDRRRLALHASDRAQTLRRRRWGATAGVLMVVAALAAGIPYGISLMGPDAERSPVALPPGVAAAPPGVETIVIDEVSGPIELVDGWYVAGNRAVLDQATGLYTPFRARTVIPSPTGRWVATVSLYGLGPRILDLTDSSSRLYELRQFTERFNSGEWSPDGTTLLVTGRIVGYSSSDPQPPAVIGAAFINAATKQVRIVEIPLPDLTCIYCVLTWLPSGSEIGLALGYDDPSGERVHTGMQTFDLNGQRLRTLPVAGIPAGTGAWSPDGREVIVTNSVVTGLGDEANGARIVDIATGAVVRTFDSIRLKQAQWIDNDQFLAWEAVVSGGETDPVFRGMASLWTRDGVLLQRWIPPIEVVELDPGPVTAALAVHLG